MMGAEKIPNQKIADMGTGSNGKPDRAVVTTSEVFVQYSDAVSRAKSRWMLAAEQLADAVDPAAARHELRNFRLYYRELVYAAACASGGHDD